MNHHEPSLMRHEPWETIRKWSPTNRKRHWPVCDENFHEKSFRFSVVATDAWAAGRSKPDRFLCRSTLQISERNRWKMEESNELRRECFTYHQAVTIINQAFCMKRRLHSSGSMAQHLGYVYIMYKNTAIMRHHTDYSRPNVYTASKNHPTATLAPAAS